MGDTISARGLAADTVDETLSIPINSYAPADTVVYVRLFSVASPHVDYTLSGGFEFVEDDSSARSLKRVMPRTGNRISPGTIDVAMIPNPMRPGAGELHMLVQSTGTAVITVYDLLGNAVMKLPDLVADHAGAYSVPVDAGGLRDGVYLVEVRMDELRGTTRFTVMQ
ncbi:MAG TPA: T9SS type A sorting domain-containing protein [Candidatus Kapabacteria bacterium]|nr:T9SS type A sorting domain-containing protein [Candidatus Kapabacteria bacterium]